MTPSTRGTTTTTFRHRRGRCTSSLFLPVITILAASCANGNEIENIFHNDDQSLPYAANLIVDSEVLRNDFLPKIDLSSECYLSYHRVFETLRGGGTEISPPVEQELPDCYFDLVRDLIAHYTASVRPATTTPVDESSSSSSSVTSSLQSSFPQLQQQQELPQIEVSNKDIASILTARPGEMSIQGLVVARKNQGHHHHRALASSLQQNLRSSGSESFAQHPSAIGIVQDQHKRRFLQGDVDQCHGAVVNVIAETINLILCMFGFASVGRAVGRAVARKLGSNAKNDIKDIVGGLEHADDAQKVTAIADIFLLSVRNLGFTAFMDAIYDNTAWYEWVLVSLVLALQLAALIASGGASIAIQIAIKVGNIALFSNAVAQAVTNCQDVGRIGCYSFAGFDFYEGYTMRLGFWSNKDFEEIVTDVCADSPGCFAVSTQSWWWNYIDPYDEWVPVTGRCKGLAVKNHLDICRNDIEGYTFYNHFDSPENTVASHPSMALESLAELCDTMGDDCQGFNAQGQLKSIIQTTPFWTRPTNLCQGLYVKKAVNVCPSAPGFTFYEGRLSSGNDLADLQDQGGFIGDLLDSCNAEGEACQGFSTFGALKSSINSIHSWEKTDLLCYGLYVRDTIPITCGDLPGYRFFPNKEQRWNDIERLYLYSNNELAAACDANPTCEGFNTDYYLKFRIQEPRFWVTTPQVSGLCEGLFVKSDVYDPPPAFCEDRVSIDTRFTRTVTCRGPRFGQTRFIWQTFDTAGQGFDDDEYVIRVFEGSNEVWTSPERYNSGTGNSGDLLLGTVDGDDVWKVQFDCTLDSSFNKCENGDFSFKLVTCGCPQGAAPLQVCDIQTMSLARNAKCPATPQPSSSPSFSPTTLEPTNSPTPFPTRFPTARPTSAPTPAPFSCFSGEVKVQVEHVGSIPMKELQIGDKVMTRPGIYEPVYAFGHIQRDQTIRFVRIHAEGLQEPLEISHDHLLYVVQGWDDDVSVVRASSVQVGHHLMIMEQSTTTTTTTTTWNHSQVSLVETVVRQGLFAPFTKSGVLIVNGALASQYITVQPSFDTLHFGDFDSGFSWHWLAHAFQAGPRLYHRFFVEKESGERICDVGEMIQAEIDEFPGIYMRWFSQMRWIPMKQDRFVQYILLPVFALPTMAVISSLYALELFLDSLPLMNRETAIDQLRDIASSWWTGSFLFGSVVGEVK